MKSNGQRAQEIGTTPVGYCVAPQCRATGSGSADYVVSNSSDAFAGNGTAMSRNSFGMPCASGRTRAPKVWKTEAGARGSRAFMVASKAATGGNPIVVPIYPTDAEIVAMTIEEAKADIAMTMMRARS